MVDLATIRRLQRKTETIHRKAESLFLDVMEAYGVEGRPVSGGDIVSDYADDLQQAAVVMLDVLDRAARWNKEQ